MSGLGKRCDVVRGLGKPGQADQAGDLHRVLLRGRRRIFRELKLNLGKLNQLLITEILLTPGEVWSGSAPLRELVFLGLRVTDGRRTIQVGAERSDPRDGSL